MLTRPWPRPTLRPHPSPGQRQRPAVATHLKCATKPVRAGTHPHPGGNNCQAGLQMLVFWLPGPPPWGVRRRSAIRYAYLNARPIFGFSISRPYRDKQRGVLQQSAVDCSVAVPESGTRKKARKQMMAACQAICQPSAIKKPPKSVNTLRRLIGLVCQTS